MNHQAIRGWQDVRDEVLRRIHARVWKPGDLIPNESDLATEMGCARATVNRALRAVAEAGLLDRRRKAGTRVALQPVAKATLNIAVIRQEVEDKGLKYGYSLLRRRTARPGATIRAAMQTRGQERLLHLAALHLADDRPYALEDRWISLTSVPSAGDAPFEEISANEWLITNVPFTHGEITFQAATATRSDAEALGCEAGSAVLVINRLTFDQDRAITSLRLVFAPGHQLRTEL